MVRPSRVSPLVLPSLRSSSVRFFFLGNVSFVLGIVEHRGICLFQVGTSPPYPGLFLWSGSSDVVLAAGEASVVVDGLRSRPSPPLLVSCLVVLLVLVLHHLGFYLVGGFLGLDDARLAGVAFSTALLSGIVLITHSTCQVLEFVFANLNEFCPLPSSNGQ